MIYGGHYSFEGKKRVNKICSVNQEQFIRADDHYYDYRKDASLSKKVRMIRPINAGILIVHWQEYLKTVGLDQQIGLGKIDVT
jgi:hypothetical protein